MANELKNCPFCGSDTVSIRSTAGSDGVGRFYKAECKCGACSKERFAYEADPETYVDVRNDWNTRPAAPVEGLGGKAVGLREGNTSADILDHKLKEAKAIIAAKDAALIKEEADHTSSLEERDRYHDIADKLAQAIADRYRTDIGEHSNINDPWQNALDLIEADNTALTARVKLVEGERDEALKLLAQSLEIDAEKAKL